MGSLRISHEAAVHIYIDAAGHAQEREHMILQIIFHLEKPAVHTDIIVLLTRILPAGLDSVVGTDPAESLANFLYGRNLRRLIGELVTHIHIKRSRIPTELPAGRNVQLIKPHGIRIDHLRKLGRPGIEFEIPLSVQADNLR